jgi:hypothetical protein
MGKWFFLTVLLSASVYVLWNGKREERLVLIILVAAFCVTYVIFVLGSRSWLNVSWGIPIFDTFSFMVLATIALRSKRFWPLPVAALHLIPVLTPIVDLVGKNLMSSALGWTQGIWSYLQLIIVVVATKRGQLRAQKESETKTSSDPSSSA